MCSRWRASSLKPEFCYKAVPVLTRHVYRLANLTNTSDNVLLTGRGDHDPSAATSSAAWTCRWSPWARSSRRGFGVDRNSGRAREMLDSRRRSGRQPGTHTSIASLVSNSVAPENYKPIVSKPVKVPGLGFACRRPSRRRSTCRTEGDAGGAAATRCICASRSRNNLLRLGPDGRPEYMRGEIGEGDSTTSSRSSWTAR